MSTTIKSGNNTPGSVNVTDNYEILVKPSNPINTDGSGSPKNVGSIRIQSENDSGEIIGNPELLSPETDDDYRLRVCHDNILDYEDFNYTAHNTSKHFFSSTTLGATITNAGITTNSNSVNTTTIGLTFGTFAMFPLIGNQTTMCETAIAFTSQCPSGVVYDFGLFQRGASTAFAPTDGAYFRLTSAGIQGVINYNGSETTTSVFPLADGAGTWVYSNNSVNRYLIQITNYRVTFWINNSKAGEIIVPIANNAPFMSECLPWSIRHANLSTTGDATFRSVVKDYKVSIRGSMFSDNFGTIGNRIFGSYQGLSGGTIGTIGTYTNNTNPTAAVPTNTTLAVGAAGLLNQAWETFTLAVNTDGILLSYQVPAGTTIVQGKRLKVNGVKLSSYVQTVLAGGPMSRTFALAFGGTTVSQATAESGSLVSNTAKARRIILLPELTQHITAAQAVNTAISQPGGCVSNFQNPIYVNPGEFVQVIVKGVGTVGTSGTIVNHIQLDYSWE